MTDAWDRRSEFSGWMRLRYTRKVTVDPDTNFAAESSYFASSVISVGSNRASRDETGSRF
jgi:hypothetical protein